MNKHSFFKFFSGGLLLAITTISMNTHAAPPGMMPRRAVWPYELMNLQERRDLWMKMRAARTSTERMELWTKKYAQLEKRGTDLGVVLREPDPLGMKYGERYSGIREERFLGPRRQEYGWPAESPTYGYGGPRYGGPRYDASYPPQYEALPQKPEILRPHPPLGR